jgi:hypothetical protein
MPYSARGYSLRAEECVRMANATNDQMIGLELLSLRQVYLQIAERLGVMETQEEEIPLGGQVE